MAKNTTRDQIWNAALTYAREWEEKPLEDKRSRYGFSADELAQARDLDASKKTITDTLFTMKDMNWLRQTSSGRGGHPTLFSK